MSYWVDGELVPKVYDPVQYAIIIMHYNCWLLSGAQKGCYGSDATCYIQSTGLL